MHLTLENSPIQIDGVHINPKLDIWTKMVKMTHPSRA